MKIKNAILIHGPGRSGTTLLNSILALHEDLAWISGYTNKYPKKLWLTALNQLQGNHFFEKLNRGKRRFPRPAEAYNFWLHYIPNFNDKNLKEIPQMNTENAVCAISRIMRYQKKERFITKITGNSRHQTLDAVFENPCIIWMDRNPKSVIMSYYKQRWGYKNDPKDFDSLPKKELLDKYFNLYVNFQHDRENLKKFNFKVFYYEDLIKNKSLFFKNICQFTELEYTPRFEKLINSWNIVEGTNISYKKYINEEEEVYLDKLIAQL